MSPTVLRSGAYRFYFFSREEPRMHVHVSCAQGEAKFWLEPILALADATGLRPAAIREVQKLIEAHHGEIVKAWFDHFGKGR